MKHFIYLFSIIFLAFPIFTISCKKDDSLGNSKNKPTPEGRKNLVRFSTSSFSQVFKNINNSNDAKSERMSLAEGSIQTAANNLFYWVVVKSTNQIYHTIQQDSTNSNFGVINDSLPYGSYSVYFAALKTARKLTTHFIDFGDPSFWAFDPKTPKIYFSQYAGTGTYDNLIADCFISKKIDINVGETPINQDVVLNRLVGALTLKINDAELYPGINFKVHLGKYGRSYNLTNDSIEYIDGLGPPIMDQLDKSTFKIYQSYIGKPFDISIEATNGSSVTQKTIHDVMCYSNVQTLLTGNFYSKDTVANNLQGFEMHIDPTWSEDTTKINY